MSDDLIHQEAQSKQEAVDNLHELIGITPEKLGPGSKERKQTFVSLAEALNLDVGPNKSKPEIAAFICTELGGTWDDTCQSAGDTVTLSGINRLVEVVQKFLQSSTRTPLNREIGESDMVNSDPEVLEEVTEVEYSIAEQISILSQASETPSEFDPSPTTYEVDEIDMASSSWMTALADVQGWLRLSSELDLSDPQKFVRSLLSGLDIEDDELIHETQGGKTFLSDAALDRLSGRLQRAVQYQDRYQADLEAEGGTRSSATGRWLEAWDDESSDEEGSGPVTALAKTWAISDFANRSEMGDLNLSPSYQRGDVWPTADSQVLIESIVRGIPLPSVIILKQGGSPYEVVDGKQRLTSILRFIGKHPRALEKVREADEQHPGANLASLFHSNYPKFRRTWKNVIGEQLNASREKEYYFPFKLRSGSTPLSGELSGLQGKYYTEIKGFSVQIADRAVSVRELFELSTDYAIPLIEYSRATPRQIHEVFNLYNKQGKHLNAEEIRNAVFHNLALMRALMVVSGDNSNMREVAPFLEPRWSRLELISQTLDDYGIGSARYRRTKVLSWLAAMLLTESIDGENPRLLSTSKHIDAMLQRVDDHPSDPLNQHGVICEALDLVFQGMEAHSGVDFAFAPKFRDSDKGVKWQELQLIASLLGVCISASVLGQNTVERLEEVSPELHQKTMSESWQRPKKTQTNTQWKYIATTALQIVDAMGVDRINASAALKKQFGFTCIPTLELVVSNVHV